MDDESKQLLQQLCDLQKEQNDLLRKHLLRLRFSVRTLLIVMTLVAIVLGLVAWRNEVRTSTTNPPSPNMGNRRGLGR